MSPAPPGVSRGHGGALGWGLAHVSWAFFPFFFSFYFFLMGTGHFFGISRAPLRYRAFPTCLEGDKLLLCETILQRGTLLMQVIINWQAFLIADPRSWSQLSQELQPSLFYGHPWVLEQLLAGTRTRLTNHPQNIPNTCGLHGEHSAEPIPARGGHFVMVHHPVALPALQ